MFCTVAVRKHCSRIKKQFFIISAPLRKAAAMHVIPADPTIGVNIPREDKLKKQSRVIHPYTEDEQKRIWEVVERRNHPGILAIGFMIETGLRAGELLALRWDKVDIPAKRIYVQATITQPTGKTACEYQNSTKSKSSNRVVPLTPRAIKILERIKSQKLDDTWVFADGNGMWSATRIWQNTSSRLARAPVLSTVGPTCSDIRLLQTATTRVLTSKSSPDYLATPIFPSR